MLQMKYTLLVIRLLCFLLVYLEDLDMTYVPREQLLYFIENGFSCNMISSMLGVSLSTIHRRLSEYGLSIRQTYSQISDGQLRNLVHLAHISFPNAGYRFIDGWLRQQGLRVQESRIRQSLRDVDPVGTANRWLQSIRRRTYSVGGPQLLWHLDGNHKLIRYTKIRTILFTFTIYYMCFDFMCIIISYLFQVAIRYPRSN